MSSFVIWKDTSDQNNASLGREVGGNDFLLESGNQGKIVTLLSTALTPAAKNQWSAHQRPYCFPCCSQSSIYCHNPYENVNALRGRAKWCARCQWHTCKTDECFGKSGFIVSVQANGTTSSPPDHSGQQFTFPCLSWKLHLLTSFFTEHPLYNCITSKDCDWQLASDGCVHSLLWALITPCALTSYTSTMEKSLLWWTPREDALCGLPCV